MKGKHIRTTQRLRRPCNRCEKQFIPTGKRSRICVKCRMTKGRKSKLINEKKEQTQ